MKQQQMKRALLAVLVSGIFLPFGVQAADADLLAKVEALTKELAALKAQVQAQAQTTQKVADKVEMAESKSLGKWLTVGGDYQFRVDSLRGETKTFNDVNATFAYAQQQLQINNQWASLSALAGFADQMARQKTYSQALAFGPTVAGMSGVLGTYNQQVAAYKPKNDTMYTNRFGLDLSAKASQDVSVSARLMMYKTFGEQNADAITNAGYAPFSADRVGVFDGTLSHVPSNSYLNVDRAYATIVNIADQDIWFSVGRRPSTNGAPNNFKTNTEKPGRGGTPALLVDYAFDGMTLGYGFDVDSMPGAYAKVCYGRGFESGFSTPTTNSLQDTDMIGLAFVPYETDQMRVWLQYNRGMSIFDAPKMQNTYFGTTMPKANLGDIDWYGAGLMGTLKNVGKGDLNYFADFGLSRTHPNQNVSAQFGFQGLLTGQFFNPEAPTDKTGTAVLLGVRYDLPSKTKLGFEYNHGSKNWITFAPATADMFTSKVGTRGNVYEAYMIQELDSAPISSRLSKTFFRLGFQIYDFKYTGSNNWVGAPVKISDVAGQAAMGQMSTLTPLSKAYDLYGTLEVKF